MRKMLAALAAIGLIAGLQGPVQAQDTISIAVVGPMTGQYATFGAQMKAGAELAAEDINAAGGVLGKMLDLSVGDDACDPKQAVSVAGQLAGRGVTFVAGHFCSGSSIPASQVYSEEGVLQISPASTNPKFTDERPGPGVFRVCGRDDQQGSVVGAYIAENFPDVSVAILHDKTAYGKGLADEVQKSLNAAGKTEELYEAITAGERDYSAVVSKMKQAGIGLVFLGGYHTEAGLIVRQMREQGMDTIMMGGDALVTDEYWQITGEAGEGTLMSFSPDPRKNPAATDLVTRFRDKGIEPEGYVLYTYAAVQAWKAAAEKAGTVDIEPMVEALNTTEFATAIGDFRFDDKGDPNLPPYAVYRWSDGQYVQITE